MKYRSAFSLIIAATILLGGCVDFSSSPGNPQTITVDALVAQGYQKVDFDLISGFPFSAAAADYFTPKTTMDQIPAAVKALDGKKVVLYGFMLPTRMDRKGIITEFQLQRGETKAGGRGTLVRKESTEMNERVIVTVPVAKGFVAPKEVGLPISVPGTLHVSQRWENGLLYSIYQLDGENIIEPK